MEYQDCALEAAVLFIDIRLDRAWSGKKEKERRKKRGIPNTTQHTKNLSSTLQTRKIVVMEKKGRKKKKEKTQNIA